MKSLFDFDTGRGRDFIDRLLWENRDYLERLERSLSELLPLP